MKILHLIAPGRMAGAERAVLAYVDTLHRGGVTAAVAVLTDSRCPELAGAFIDAAVECRLRVVEIPVSGRVDFRAPLLLARLARSYDVIHAHGYKALSYAALVPIPRVATHHGDTSVSASVRAYERLSLGLYRTVAKRVVAVSDTSCDELAERGVPRERLRTIPNFVVRPPLDVGTVRANQLVFIGRLSPEKNVSALIEAVRALPETTLLVVGDGPERASLEAATEGLQARVTFAGWVSDVSEALGVAAAVVLPSLREGMPLTVLEAGMAGRPLVCSRVGGIPDVVTDGRNGVLTRPGDSASLLAGLRRLLNDQTGYLERAQAEIPVIAERFGPQRWLDAALKMYREVLA